MKKTYNISFEAFYRWENASFEKNIPLRSIIKPDGGVMEIVTLSKVKELYPIRKVNGHKGTFGRVVIIAGSDRYTGAVQLCCKSALRSGAGIVTVLTADKAAKRVCISCPEAIVRELDCSEGAIVYSERNADIITAEVSSADAVLFGCGMTNSEGTLRLLEHLLKNTLCPVIIDADGINTLATRIELLRNAKADILLTPHVGELARLCGVSVGDAIARRCELARELSRMYGITVLAKSSSSVIASSNGMFLTLWGNDGLARGGSGDTLAGICASLLAGGMNTRDSAVLASSVLGLGCDMLTRRGSTRGLLASDIIRILPMLFKKIERLD